MNICMSKTKPSLSETAPQSKTSSKVTEILAVENGGTEWFSKIKVLITVCLQQLAQIQVRGITWSCDKEEAYYSYQLHLYHNITIGRLVDYQITNGGGCPFPPITSLVCAELFVKSNFQWLLRPNKNPMKSYERKFNFTVRRVLLS